MYNMKRILTLFCIILLISGKLGLLGALELEISAGINNFTFQPEKTTAGDVFDPYQYILGNLSLRGDISKAWGFDFNLKTDNIFQYTADFRLKTRTDYFGFDFGLFTGMTDSFEIPDFGILGSIEATLPGIMFLSVGGSSTICSKFDFTGNNYRESFEAKLGFWLPFAIPVFSVSSKSFTRFIPDDPDPIRDNLIRFQFSSDFFGKTSPLSLRVDAGYQILSRIYDVDDTDELSSWFAGLDFQYSISKALRLFVGAEMPFVVTATSPLTASDEFWTMFKAYGGFIIRFF